MKAAYINSHGNIEDIVVGEIDDPEVKDDEVLIEIKYAALNHLDLFVLKGWKGLSLDFPHVLGSDGSGIVKEIGKNVSKVSAGDPVTINPGVGCGKCDACLSGNQNFCTRFYIVGEHQWGTYATYFKIPERNVLKIPNGVSLEKAATPLAYLTAWRMLVTRGKISPGKTVLVQGGSGGVATAAIQIAKYFDAKVIATTSTREKAKKLKKLGVDHVVNYNEINDVGKHIYKEITKKQGVDIAIDSVGTSTFSQSLRLLKPGGKLITCGATTGPLTEIDIRLIFWKQLEILGSTMSNHSEFLAIMRLILEGKINPVIDSKWPLEKIKEAEMKMADARIFGKILIEMR